MLERPRLICLKGKSLGGKKCTLKGMCTHIIIGCIFREDLLYSHVFYCTINTSRTLHLFTSLVVLLLNCFNCTRNIFRRPRVLMQVLCSFNLSWNQNDSATSQIQRYIVHTAAEWLGGNTSCQSKWVVHWEHSWIYACQIALFCTVIVL